MQTDVQLFRDRRFLLSHLVLPTAIFMLLAWLSENTLMDLWLANHIFSWEGGAWNLRQNWLTFQVMHHWGNVFVCMLATCATILFALSWRFQRWEKWRGSTAYFMVCMIMIPSSIAFMKRFSEVPCPWDLANFGGSLVYQHNLDYALGLNHGGHCFPAGHASGGYVLLALYFAVFPHFRTRRWVYLLPGLLTGLSFGVAQQLRGAHFFSHDVWTAFIAWTMALAIFALFQSRYRLNYADSTRNGQPCSYVIDR